MKDVFYEKKKQAGAQKKVEKFGDQGPYAGMIHEYGPPASPQALPSCVKQDPMIPAFLPQQT